MKLTTRYGFILLVMLTMVHCEPKNFEDKLDSLLNYTVPTIQTEELSKSLDSEKQTILLDTRSEEEFRVSHLPGATLVVFDDFEPAMVQDLPKDVDIVVYCSVGYRSEKIGEKLMELGYERVQNLYGGIFQWKNEGQAVISARGDETDSIHTYNENWSKWLTKGVKVY